MAKEELGWAPDSRVPSEPLPASGCLHPRPLCSLQAASSASRAPPSPALPLAAAPICATQAFLSRVPRQGRARPALSSQHRRGSARAGPHLFPWPGCPSALFTSHQAFLQFGQVGPSQLGSGHLPLWPEASWAGPREPLQGGCCVPSRSGRRGNTGPGLSVHAGVRGGRMGGGSGAHRRLCGGWAAGCTRFGWE